MPRTPTRWTSPTPAPRSGARSKPRSTPCAPSSAKAASARGAGSRSSGARTEVAMPTADDPFNLHRFVDAQAPVYERVRAELKDGRKQSHWMWFIFPQIAGLGHSQMAQRYAISSLREAEAYLKHAILGPRLRGWTRLLTGVHGRS